MDRADSSAKLRRHIRSAARALDREAIAAVRFEMKGGEQQEDLERSVSRRNRDFS